MWGDTSCGLDFLTLREGRLALAFPSYFIPDGILCPFHLLLAPTEVPTAASPSDHSPEIPQNWKALLPCYTHTPRKRTAILCTFISSFPRDCALFEYSDHCSHALNRICVAWKKFYFFLRGLTPKISKHWDSSERILLLWLSLLASHHCRN